MKQFVLPDPGEGLVEAEVVTWRVQPGDVVKVNDIVVEIETSKSLVELPSPYAGTVVELLVAEGTTVAVGTPIITIDDGSTAKDPAGGSDSSSERESAGVLSGEVEAGDHPGPMLVGSGPKSEAGSRRIRRGQRSVSPGQGTAGQESPGQSDEAQRYLAGSYEQSVPSRRADAVTEPQPVHAEAHGDPLPRPGEPPRGSDLVWVGADGEVLAKPPVRKYAKTLGVDLSTVTGTGPDGVITRGDVEAAAALQQLREREQARPRNSWQSAPGEWIEDPVSGSSAHGAGHQSAMGGERRVPFKGVRKVTAEAMTDSVTKHVHVTEWTTVDVSATMAMVDRLRNRREFANLRVSPLLIFAKAVCMAMANTPEMNCSFDADTDEIVFYDDVNLGIAAATPRGLMVPNIKGASRMNLIELCTSINSLVQVAKEGRLQPADYSGGTFTITNVGVFGIDSGTPIINRDESAILCMGSIERRPWVVSDGTDERIEPRWVTTISISFDHRVIDGEQGSRFLHEVASLLNDPQLALLY